MLCWLCTTLGTRPLAAESETPDRLERGIAAGQEELLAKILGRGMALPGDCRFAGGKAVGAIVTAEYACGADTVVVELRHPARLEEIRRQSSAPGPERRRT